MRAGCDKAARKGRPGGRPQTSPQTRGSAVQLLLERLYGRILTAYPAEFRHEYAAEMVEFFGEDCRRAARRHGLAGLLAQGADVIVQDVRFAFRMLRKDPGFGSPWQK